MNRPIYLKNLTMLKHPEIDPVALSLGPLSIHWYGLMYLIGFVGAWWIASNRAGRDHYALEKDQVDDLIFFGALGVVLGGRFGYVLFYNFDRFLQEPLWLFQVWEGGMSFHGGALGVILATALYGMKKGIPAGRTLDFVAPLVPIGLGAGRLGNFIGQELWGRETDVPWGMLFPNDPEQLVRHPSQLYQAFLEGLLFFIILYWFSSKRRPTWAVGGMFMVCYGCFRFFVEFFREPDSHIGFDLLGWMTRGQLLSIPMIILGVWLLYWAYFISKEDLSKPLRAAEADVSAAQPKQKSGKSKRRKKNKR